MAQDNISLMDYRPEWAAKAADEIALIMRTLSKSLVREIEHVGSTAVPGIKAKPIIDIIILASSIQEAQAAISPIKSLGYQYWEEDPDKTRMFFVKGMPPYGTGRTHHILMVEDEKEVQNRIAFRDYLRSHPEAALQYEALKLKLADTLSEDREAYTGAKTDFVREIVRRANKEKK